MTLVASQITVGPSQTVLARGSDAMAGIHYQLCNRGAVSMFIGPDGVTVTGANAGYEIRPGEADDGPLESGETLFAITAIGTTRADVKTGAQSE